MFGNILRRWLWQIRKSGKVEAVNGELWIWLNRSEKDIVHGTSIKSWVVAHEMGMDAITIVLTNGKELYFVDEYNDVIDALQRVVPEKRL